MEIRQLRHFVAVADALNFRQAADRVNLSQQAVSKSIIQLEAQVGLKLLDRTRQSVALTSFGALLLPYARTILAEIQEFDDLIADAVGRKFGQLRIGATPTLLDDIVPTTLGQFHKLNPRIRVVVERGDFTRLRDLLLRGELDVILSTAPDETQSHLIAIEEISTDQNIVIVRADHSLANGQLVSCEQLRAYPRMATHNYQKGDAYLTALFSSVGQTPPQVSFKTASMTFALSWLLQGDHWWVAPRRQVSRALRDGSLAELPVPLQDVSWPLVIATRRLATRSHAVLTYREIVRSHVRQEVVL